MRVLITGGTGFIGIPLMKKLLASGHKLLIYDAFPNEKALGSNGERVQVVQGDVTSWTELYDATRNFSPEGIIHLAALISQHAEQHMNQAIDVNVNGTLTVLEIARKLGIKRVLLPSTVATFSSDVPAPIADDEVQKPKTIYGITKVFCELLGTYYSQRYGIDFRSVRLPSIIGPGRTNGGASVYASLMIEEPAKGLPYEAQAAPDSAIPVLYITDAVNAIATLFEARNSPRTLYNASGITPTASQIASEVKKHVPDARITFKSNPQVVNMLKQWQQMDSRNFQKDMGWRILFPLEKLIPDFVFQVRKSKKG
jgi:threonine 3-dehydrogenase